jgi:polyvinyl alcohol dehydrogenase (cytochrome)
MTKHSIPQHSGGTKRPGKIALFLVVLSATAVFAQDGAAIYRARCAGCHDTPTGRVPPLSALRAMSPSTIMQSLESGPMKIQSAGLTSTERYAVVTYLATPIPKRSAPPSPTAFCRTQPQPFRNASESQSWIGWGADPANTRFQDIAAAGMTPDDVRKLKLKWAFGLGDGTSVRSQPGIGAGRVFIADLTGEIYALDAQTGCIQWSFEADTPVHSAVIFGTSAGPAKRAAVYFGDRKANAYGLDAATGQLLWKTHVGDHFASFITGAPQLHGHVVYVPVSSYEEALAGSPRYECCTFRGSVVALDAGSGKTIWRANTIAQSPQPTSKSKTDVQLRGPSGAAVWSAPTFDEKRNVLYVATGDNYSSPSSATSDAVLCLDANDGKVLWSKQLTAGDIYNMGPDASGHDFDFGQPPILVSLPNGHRALVIGQKSGVVHCLDPDRHGEILWQTRVGKGGALGGIMWGSAADRENMYVALSDLSMAVVADKTAAQGYRLELDPKDGGGLFALGLKTGEKVWTAKPVACAERKHCSPAQSAAVTAIPGVVFSGSVDGHLRAYSAATGQIIWDFDTVRDYETSNGATARGGSLDCAGPVIAGGMLYVTSGYGQWGGMPGNVLLAFSVDGE